MDNSFFRVLNAKETKAFQKWARENYSIGDEIPHIHHPVIRAECEKMNKEAKHGQGNNE